MGFPWQLSVTLTKHLVKNSRQVRYPHVLMLEPLFRCNLACSGCGRIREYSEILDRSLSLEECMDAVHETDAPVVSITGGEPLIHPEIGRIANEIVGEKRFVHLCTNGVLLETSLDKFSPSPYMSFVLHLDGLKKNHDRFAGQDGIFESVITGIQAAKKANYRVLTNTTLYKGTNLDEIIELFQLLSRIPVDGIMVTPAFGYESVGNDVFPSRTEIPDLFRPIYSMRDSFSFYNTPVYLEFLAGFRELNCTPWSTPTRNPKGWRRPCYLLADEHCSSFRELMDETPWENYGPGNDRRCDNCMVHCGYEASALREVRSNFGDLWKTIRWHFKGLKPRSPFGARTGELE